ncbi:MAG: hypothetical protein ACRDEA_15835, partial [Microcystaceae cyanobacterium]
ILHSGRLWHPQKDPFYQDIYDEARQNLMLYICQEIERYNPERASVMAWVNTLLYKRFFREAIAQARNNPVKTKLTLSNLQALALSEQTPLKSEQIREFIELDPEDCFKNEWIENHPEANFQVLLRRRIVGDSWKNISADLGTPISTLSSFYQRCLQKFTFKFKEYLQQ